MSLKKVTRSSGLNREKSGKPFRKQINAAGALLAMAASLGMASAQTSFTIASVNSGQVIDLPEATPNTLPERLFNLTWHADPAVPSGRRKQPAVEVSGSLPSIQRVLRDCFGKQRAGA